MLGHLQPQKDAGERLPKLCRHCDRGSERQAEARNTVLPHVFLEGSGIQHGA